MMEDKKTGVTQKEAEVWIKECYQRPDDETAAREALDEKCQEMNVPGHIVEFDPEEARLCGAFLEDALDEETALAATQDRVV